MMWLYVVLVVVVLAALPLTWWLKREGDRAWRRRSKVGQITVKITADTAAFTRAMREAAAATAAFGAEMNRMHGPLEQLGRDLDRRLEPFRQAVRRMLADREGRA